MTRLIRIFLLLVTASVGCSFGCSSNRSAGAGPVPDGKPFCQLGPACQAITQACMMKDDAVSNMTVHNCHLTAMFYAVESDCEDQMKSCIAYCTSYAPPFDADTTFDFYATCVDGGSGTFPP